MTIYELTKKYGEGRGEATMWSTVAIVSEAVEALMTEAEKNSLIRRVYGMMSDGHYNEEFAREDIAKMYYTDRDGVKRYGPYWPDSALRSIYDKIKAQIPGYNCWDWAVTMSMIKSDYCPLLTEWFPADNEDIRNERIVRLAINWLRDEDSPLGKSKTWKYFNSGE